MLEIRVRVVSILVDVIVNWDLMFLVGGVKFRGWVFNIYRGVWGRSFGLYEKGSLN